MSLQEQFEREWPAIDQVQGWLSPGQERALFDLAASLPNSGRILELGCFLGRSTVSMGAGCRGTARRIYCVDTFAGNDSDFIKGVNEIDWDGATFLDQFYANVASCELTDYIIAIQGTTAAISEVWTAKVDMLFIDAGHQLDDVRGDYERFKGFVKPGGIVALHDVTPGWPEVYEYWNTVVAPGLRDVSASGSLAWGTLEG